MSLNLDRAAKALSSGGAKRRERESCGPALGRRGSNVAKHVTSARLDSIQSSSPGNRCCIEACWN